MQMPTPDWSLPTPSGAPPGAAVFPRRRCPDRSRRIPAARSHRRGYARTNARHSGDSSALPPPFSVFERPFTCYNVSACRPVAKSFSTRPGSVPGVLPPTGRKNPRKALQRALRGFCMSFQGVGRVYLRFFLRRRAPVYTRSPTVATTTTAKPVRTRGSTDGPASVSALLSGAVAG